MKIVYFAWLRERIGMAEEEVAPPPEVASVADLIGWLKARSPGHAAAFADLARVRVAVNQEYASLGAKVGPADEVAFFPPVTGGRA